MRVLCSSKTTFRYLILAMATVWLASCATTASQGDHESGVVQAKEFRLVDSRGRVQGRLSARKDGPLLVLYDQSGNARLAASVAAGVGPVVELYSKSLQPRIQIHVLDGGPAAVVVNGESRASNVGLVTGTDGSAILFFEISGGSPLTLGLNHSGNPGVQLKDRNGQGRVILQMVGESPGSASLGFFDSVGRNRLTIGQDPGGTTSILFLDSQGNVSRAAEAPLH